ncbi:USP47 family protein [Megaselia abdita]
MVQLPDEEKTICVVYDTTPSSTQKRMNLVVRSTYDIRKLFETVKTQYQYDDFQLVMQASDEEEINKFIYLNDKPELRLYDVPGFWPGHKNQMIILPPNTWENKEERDLALKSLPSHFTSPTSSVLLTPPAEIQTSTDTSTANSFVGQGIDSSSTNISPVTPDAFDYDLALGASASPTEEIKGKLPFFDEGPDLPQEANDRTNGFDYNREVDITQDYTQRETPTELSIYAKYGCSQYEPGTLLQLPAAPVVSQSHNYTGLVNQAMTCYLNSLLQALFMTPEFRNALYRWEFDNDKEDKNIPYQLQKLFLNLQTNPKSAVETTDLTRSFGWDSTEAWQQHDIQELCRVMFDALEVKFKSTKQAKLITNLYEGKLIDYVKCLDCNTEKTRADTFLDIPLPVRPFGSQMAYSSIEEALRAFVQPETLDGNNRYFCEKCNKKCDAHKGLKFKEFPYILTLHLKRFDFDYTTLHRIKLNDKVTFPQTLNLNAFVNSVDAQTLQNNNNNNLESVKTNGIVMNGINNNTDDCSITDSGAAMEEDNSSGIATTASSSQHENDMQDDDEGISVDTSDQPAKKNEKGPYNYELFAIMIHSGSATGGHYYAYIKDFESKEWFCFNDQSVTGITQEDIQKSYGGCSIKSYYSGMFTSSTNAYMLMYRQMDTKRNESAFQKEQFPKHIIELLEKMNSEEETKRQYTPNVSDIIKAKCYVYNKKLKKMKNAKVHLSRSYDIATALESAYETLSVSEFAPLSRCRLVLFDHTEDDLVESFEGVEHKDRTVGSIMNDATSGLSFLLETREENEVFEEYKREAVQVKVFKVDTKTKAINGPYYVRALGKENVKEAVAQKFKYDIKKLLTYHGYFKTNTKVFVAEAKEEVNEDMESDFIDFVVSNYTGFTYFYITHPSTDAKNLNILGIPSYSEPQKQESQKSCDVVDAVMMSSGGAGGDYSNNQHSPIPFTPVLAAENSNSEDSSLSDGDRTLVGVSGSSSSHSPQVLTPEDESVHPCAQIDDEYFAKCKSLELNDDCDYNCHSSLVHNPTSLTSSTDNDDSSALAGASKTFKIFLDRNTPIGTLKRFLAPIIQIPTDYFKIIRRSASSIRSEELSSTEKISYFSEGEELKIDLGKILKKDEMQAKIFYMKLSDLNNESGKLVSICNCVINSSMTALDAKKQLVVKLHQLDGEKYKNLTVKNCRLWEKGIRNLVKIMTDDQTLKLETSMKNYSWELLVQECEGDVVTTPPEDSLTLFVRRWHPSTLELDQFQEITLLRESKIQNTLASISDIPENEISYTKVNGMFPGNNTSLLNINTSMGWFTNEATLDNYPLLQTMSGSIFFYKDSKEEPKVLTPEEHRELNMKEKARLDRVGGGSSSSTSSYYTSRRERALKIYVDSSPKTASSSREDR